MIVIDVAPGVQMIRARSGFRMANTYILGIDDLIVVEPVITDNRIEGPMWVELFHGWTKKGRRVKAVVQTHLHPDHYCLAASGELGVPFFDPPQSGDKILNWDVLATPGHAEEHVCLFDGSILVAGDMISTDGDVLIPPNEFGGNFDEYRQQCKRLASFNPELALPAHGDPIWHPREAFLKASERVS